MPARANSVATDVGVGDDGRKLTVQIRQGARVPARSPDQPRTITGVRHRLPCGAGAPAQAVATQSAESAQRFARRGAGHHVFFFAAPPVRLRFVLPPPVPRLPMPDAGLLPGMVPPG